YTYQWQVSTDGITFAAGTGLIAAENYDPGVLTATTYFRRMVTCGGESGYTNTCTTSIGTPPSSANMNYIRTRTLAKPLVKDTVTADGLTSPSDVQQTTQYFDGLGRPVQTVSRQITPQGKDLVMPQVYDPLGREAVHYLPYASSSSDGNYKPNPLGEQNSFNSTQYSGEQFYYGQTEYEPSPLNRILNS